MVRVCMMVHFIYHLDARVRRYAEALADAGIEVDVLCLRDKKISGIQERKNLRVVSIPLTRSAQHIPAYVLEYLAGFVLFSVWLLALFARRRYEIIHTHNMPDFIVFTTLIPRLLGAKVILDIHDPMPEVYKSKFGSRKGQILQQFLRWQEKLSCRYANEIIVANSTFKKNLVMRGVPTDKTTVVNNLPDSAWFNRALYQRKTTARKSDFVLIYPGTIAPRYGLEVAIRALPQLVARIPNVRLLIISRRAHEAIHLAELADELGVASSLELRPGVLHAEMPHVLVQADVGIYTGLSDPHMDIAVPTKVLEYAWMGLPIVSSRLPVLEDMFDDSAILFFEPGNTEQFAECVLRLYENPSLGEELVRRADQTFVTRHSWSDERRNYFDLLSRMLPPDVS